MAAHGDRTRTKVRVAHVGTGVTGREALRGIIANTALELVGLSVSSAEKVGRDAGELVGVDPVGVVAVGSLDELLASKPDVLSYCPNGLGREAEAVSEIAKALAAGVDVITISLLGLLYPPAAPEPMRAPLAEAAAKGSSTFLSTGLDPGFSSDVLPLALLTMSDAVEHVHIQEIGIYDHYDVEPVIRGIMGFGHPVTYAAPITAGGAFQAFWGPMVQQLADRMGVELDELVGTSDRAVHGEDLNTSVGVMEAGTVVALRVACEGRVAGQAVITAEHITRMAADVAPDWPKFDGVGESNYRVTIQGNPNMVCDLDLGRSGDVWGSVSGTAMRLVNLISEMPAAPTGLISSLDLPLVPSRNVVTQRARVDV